MDQYLTTLKQIYETGNERPTRTGLKSKSLFGLRMEFDLTKGFPAVTTKKLAMTPMAAELLWFLEGSRSDSRLKEITYGVKNSCNDTIWTANAFSDYWMPKSTFLGDVGRIYGVQWRKWNKYELVNTHEDETGWTGEEYRRTEIDQIANLIDGLKNDPYGRRHVVTAWNPAELDQMCLPPCHMFFQMYVNDGKLSTHMYQRSADWPLGVPFNIASYALLTHMVAQVCDLGVDKLIMSFGDGHIYENQYEGVEEQLKRTPKELPKLWLNPDIKDINKFTLSPKDMRLDNYDPHPPIKFPFAV